MFCLMEEESLVHLLFLCPISVAVWNEIEIWIGLKVEAEVIIWKIFSKWFSCIRKKKVKVNKEGFILMAVIQEFMEIEKQYHL